MTETLKGRIALALEELDEHVSGYVAANDLAKFLDEPDYDGTLSEIADSSVPIYTSDILDVAASDYEVSLRKPECGPAFDGVPNPVNIAAANIYELVQKALDKDIKRRKKEANNG